MVINSSVPDFPPRGMLQRFFRTDRSAPVHLDDAARLLGMTSGQALAMAEREGTLLRNGMLSWEEVAHQLFLQWPRVELLDVLGVDDHHRIPTLFFPMRLQLHLPLYLHLAMDHQAKRAWGEDERGVFPRGIHDYIADILHEHVDERTLFAFRDNGPFIEAFHYPVLPSEVSACAGLMR